MIDLASVGASYGLTGTLNDAPFVVNRTDLLLTYSSGMSNFDFWRPGIGVDPVRIDAGWFEPGRGYVERDHPLNNHPASGVPEPSSLIMLVIGVLGFGVGMNRRE